MNLVRSRFGNDVDNAAERPAVLGFKTVVHHAKFADGFLRGRCALRTRGRVDVVGAVHGNFVVQVALAAKGYARGAGVGKRRLQADTAGGHAGAQ